MKKFITGGVILGLAFLFSGAAYAATLNVSPVIATDNNSNFGAPENEAVGIDVNITLNELFADDGLQYTYTVLNGGSFSGAAPAMAVITLEDGRRIILFPGWGDRTGTYTLTFSETTASDTGGNNLVDFEIRDSGMVRLYGSGPTYGDFEFVKTDTDLINGLESVVRVAIQHQAANSGQVDRIDSILISGALTNYYGTIQAAIDEIDTIQAGN